MALETRRFDPALYVDGNDGMAAYLDEAFATNDPAFVSDALGVVARAAGMTELARKASVSRESLYRALSPEGNPELKTIMKVLAALGLHLSVSSAVEPQAENSLGTEAAAG